MACPCFAILSLLHEGGEVMTERHFHRTQQQIVARSDQPLIGILDREDDHDVVRYFTQEEEADAASSQASTRRALDLAGVWSDLDWDEAQAALDRIRHESTPTPPIAL